MDDDMSGVPSLSSWNHEQAREACSFDFVSEREWNLDEHMDKERRERLLNPPAAADLLIKLANDVRHAILQDKVRIKWIEACDQKGYYRIEAKNIPISEHVFDWLWNGRSGYRAQYYLSEELGQAYNEAAINSLMSTLVNLPNCPNMHPLGLDHRMLSIKGLHSKIWFSDDWRVFCNPEHLRPVRWVGYWDKMVNEEKMGLKAPPSHYSNIDLKGTFICPKTGEPWIPTEKKRRACQIHLSGWDGASG